jgi:hypothetical protein
VVGPPRNDQARELVSKMRKYTETESLEDASKVREPNGKADSALKCGGVRQPQLLTWTKVLASNRLTGVVCNDTKMNRRHKTNNSWVRFLAFGLAVLSILFVVQAQTHWHANSQDEAACQVCQVAHVGSASAPVGQPLLAPLLTTGYVELFVVSFHQELFFHDSPSRAPPST